MYRYLIIIVCFYSVSCVSDNKTIVNQKLSNNVICSNSENEIVYLEPSFTVDSLNDSVFFSHRINQIYFTDAFIFFSDQVESEIFKLDHGFKFISRFGKKGEGPGEYIDIRNFTVDKEEARIVVNGVNKMLNYTLGGDFVSEFPIEGSSGWLNLEFVSKNSNILLSTVFTQAKPQSLFIENEKSYKVYDFGEFWNMNSTFYHNENSRHIINNSVNSEFYIIGHESPYIEIYSYDDLKVTSTYKIVKKIDLSNVNLIQDYFVALESGSEFNSKKDKIIGTLVQDVTIYNNKIYLLIRDINAQTKEKNTDKIIVLNLNGDSCIINNIYQLHNINKTRGWYLSFGVYNDQIIAFDTISGSFHVFNI